MTPFELMLTNWLQKEDVPHSYVFEMELVLIDRLFLHQLNDKDKNGVVHSALAGSIWACFQKRV